MAAFLRDAGLVFSVNAYDKAGLRGHVAMVRWLAQKVGVSAEGLNLDSVIGLRPSGTAARNRDLLLAVQAVVGVAGCRGWKAGRPLSYAVEWGDLRPPSAVFGGAAAATGAAGPA